jgi:hypothetical protein
MKINNFFKEFLEKFKKNSNKIILIIILLTPFIISLFL